MSSRQSNVYGQSGIFICLAAGLISGCVGGNRVTTYPVPSAGRSHAGKQVIVHFQCGQCHTIPGVGGANGVFGPPLSMMADRTYIAGNFANTPDNMTHWILAPSSMKPKTAMPDLGLSEQQARDAAAYLYTLR